MPNDADILRELQLCEYFQKEGSTKNIWISNGKKNRLHILDSIPFLSNVDFKIDYFLMRYSAVPLKYYFCDRANYIKWVAESIQKQFKEKYPDKDEPLILEQLKNNDPVKIDDVIKELDEKGKENNENGSSGEDWGQKNALRTKNCGAGVFFTDNITDMTKHIKEVFGLGTQEEQLKALIEQGERAIILHGAPGTGKTYTAREKLAGLFKDSQEIEIGTLDNNGVNFVQFHPSYDYTDFVEGYRPAIVKGKEDGQEAQKDGQEVQKEGERVSTFVRMDGIFKAFCRDAAAAVEEDKKKQEKKKLYPFIIDEINRADLAKVFGELMFCVENGYRGEQNCVKTQYDYLPTYKVEDKKSGLATLIKDDVFQNGFYIPDNVIIIGTMNDIDRSVESIDFAMRRRFRFINVEAGTEMRTGLEGMLLEIEDKEIVNQLFESVKKLNDEIKKSFGEAYQIGHGYFKNFGKYYNAAEPNDKISGSAFVEAKRKVWNYSLKPLLEEYMRGRRTGIELETLGNTFILGVKPHE